jgi:hypothetical protein
MENFFSSVQISLIRGREYLEITQDFKAVGGVGKDYLPNTTPRGLLCGKTAEKTKTGFREATLFGCFCGLAARGYSLRAAFAAAFSR